MSNEARDTQSGEKDGHGPMCAGCLMLTFVVRAEKAEKTLRDWGIEPNAEVDEQFRRHLAAINRAEGRTGGGS